MIGLEILVKINSEKRTEFFQLFEMVKKASEPVEGRLNLELFEQVNNPNTFLWREHWQNVQFLIPYYRDNKYRAMIGALNILGKLVHKKTFFYEGGSQNV